MRRIALLVAFAAGAVVAAAVVFSSSGAPAQAAVRHAATRTLETGSSRFTITYSYGGNTAMNIAEGVMDYTRHRGTLAFGKAGLDLVFDGDVTYTRLPDVGSFPKGKWLRTEGIGFPLSDPQARALEDPSTLLGTLQSASSGVIGSGGEIIGGVRTTRYEGTLDFQKVVEHAPTAQRADLETELDLLRQMGQAFVPFSVWVDSSGVARRLRMRPLPAASVTIDFHDFGAPVDVRVPSADDVLSETEFRQVVEAANAGSGGCGGADTRDGDDSGGSAQVCLFFSDSDSVTATSDGP